MPKNLLLRYGIIIVVACALLWLGGEVLNRLIWLFKWIGGFGILLLVVGVIMEIMKSRKAVATATAPVPGAIPVTAPSYLDDISAHEKQAAIDEIQP